ncbi:MAG: hypothetical protein H6617_06235 [Bdellovibrionaceae bacterium]|nr:hypothetical protein [Bdellovibrionales bacterium]MCB9254263.1 hypothetical protein [Pseudobdellovibrionaceae bacterium]
MYRYRLPMLVCLLGFWSVSGIATTAARTSARYMAGGHVVLGPQKLTGSIAPHTYTEFFAPNRPAWLSELVQRYSSGTAETFMKLLETPVGAYWVAADLHYVVIDPNAMYDHVEIDFEVWSDSKPIRNVRMMAPENGGFRFDAPQFDKSHLSAKTRVHLDPKALAPGNYPLLFVAREGACKTCLSEEHLVVVRIQSPCRRHPANLACRPQYVERSREDLKSAALFERLHSMAGPGLSAATEAARRCTRERNCTEEILGACPDLALGVGAPACSKIREIEEEKAKLFAAREEVDQFFAQTDCCKDPN